MRVWIGFEAKREVVCLTIHPMEGIGSILVGAPLIGVVVSLISLKIDFALPLQTGASSPQMLRTLAHPHCLPIFVSALRSIWSALIIFGLSFSPPSLSFLTILFFDILFKLIRGDVSRFNGLHRILVMLDLLLLLP